MTQKEKLIEKFKQSPQSISFSELQRIMQWIHIEIVKGKGSHIIFKKESRTIITIPLHNNDCKPFYKKLALKILTSKNLLQ